jgi:hypothetical protein
VGTRHVLFPRLTNIWRPTSPVECRWLSVPRRCVDRQERLSFSLRLRSGAGLGVTTNGFLGETSSPGVTHLPIRTFQTSETVRSERVNCFTSIQGRHRAILRHRSFALNHGSCLLTLTLHFFSQTDDPVFTAPPACSDFIASLWSSSISQCLPHDHSFRDVGDPFFSLRLRPRLDSTAFYFSFFAVRSFTTTLTHSSNVRSLDRLCPPSAPFKTWSIRHHSALRMVSCLSSGRTPHTSLAAWFPSSLRGKERPFPRKPVTLASDYLPHLRVAHRFYTDLSKGPGTSVRPDRCVRLSSDSIPERVVL